MQAALEVCKHTMHRYCFQSDFQGITFSAFFSPHNHLYRLLTALSRSCLEVALQGHSFLRRAFHSPQPLLAAFWIALKAFKGITALCMGEIRTFFHNWQRITAGFIFALKCSQAGVQSWSVVLRCLDTKTTPDAQLLKNCEISGDGV